MIQCDFGQRQASSTAEHIDVTGGRSDRDMS
jgi:hypothetical protein